jgi:hypothetical protein
MAFHMAINFLHNWREAAMHSLLPAIFVYFLFRPCELVFFIACAETNFSGNAP